MMMKTLLCAAVIIAVPMVASATVVNPGEIGSETKTLTPGSVTSFLFEPSAETTVSFTVTGNGQVSDLAKLSYGFSPVAGETKFSQVFPLFAGLGIGVGVLESVTTKLPFFVYFFGNGAASTSVVTVTYTTDEATPAPVPLPAAGGLLALALGGMGIAASRRRAK